MLAWTLHNLGDVVRAPGDHDRAAVLREESLQLFQELGGKGALATVWSMQASGTQALGATPELPSTVTDENPEGLTRREIEVLRLIAEGLTDAQVADRLVLSTRTVQAHLRSIYGKLNITTRTAATRYAMEHGFAGTMGDRR
jgi:DNA-binding NarL/FixJ family response regulator